MTSYSIIYFTLREECEAHTSVQTPPLKKVDDVDLRLRLNPVLVFSNSKPLSAKCRPLEQKKSSLQGI